MFTFKCQLLLTVRCDLHTYGLEHLSSEGEGGLGYTSLRGHLAGVLPLIAICQIMDEEAAGAVGAVHLEAAALRKLPPVDAPHHVPDAALTDAGHPHGSFTGLGC